MLNKAIRELIGFRRALFVLLLFRMVTLSAQMDTLISAPPSFSIGFFFQKGFIIPHSEAIRSISYSHPWILESSFAWHFSDPQSVSYCNCYPRLGVSTLYINFNNPGLLGQGFALAPYAEPFIFSSNSLLLSFQFSAGAVYLTKVYDPVSNPDNLFYSSPVSYILSLSFGASFRLSPTINSRLSVNYNHISNGGNRQPNKGINFPTASLGLEYIFRPINLSRQIESSINSVKRKNTFRLAIFGTAKKPFQATHTRYMLYGVNVGYGHLFSRMNALLAGLEFVNDLALKEELKQNGMETTDQKRVAALAGHEFEIGRFRFSQQLGVYLYSPAKPKDPVYQRWGLDYSLTKQIFIGINLKAHRHVADFMDIRFGIVL